MSVHHEPGSWDFEKLGHRGRSFPVPDATANFTIVEIDGILPTVLRQRACEFTFYVLGGAGAFTIEGGREPVSEGDLVMVPRGSRFTYGGELRMLLVSNPAWHPEQEDDLGLTAFDGPDGAPVT